MKNPRQILFDSHQSAEPGLDQVRQNVLSRLNQARLPQPAGQRRLPGMRASLGALLRSMRWHLAAMSAIWMVVLLLNRESSSTPPVIVAKQNRPSPRQLLMALRENRRQLLQMMEPSASEAPAPPLAPSRRSEVQFRTEM